MKNKKIIIVIIIIILVLLGYFLYNYIENKDYEKIEEITIIENTEKEENGENNKEETKEKQEENDIEKNIVIHIVGEVINEGVYEIKEGSRVIDAVEKAGGLTEEADLSKINLAYILSDEMKIYIPKKYEEKEFKEDEEEQYISVRNGRK